MPQSPHATAAGFHRAGFVDDAATRELDALCLTGFERPAPEAIRAVRDRERVSQPVVARYLNIQKE